MAAVPGAGSPGRLKGSRRRLEGVGVGVTVLLKIYARCIDGHADAANRRITDALGTPDARPAALAAATALAMAA